MGGPSDHRASRKPPERGLPALPAGRSVAGQVFLLQVVVVVLLVVAAVVELLVQARHDSEQEARNRSVAVATTFASSPGIAAALESPDPTAVLQPRAEQARRLSGVDFIVVTDRQGIRYTHPKPDRIGKKFVGDIGPALRGQVVTESIVGTIGPLVQANVPVLDDRGRVVGIVSSGITIAKVSGAVNDQLPVLLGFAAGVLALATAGTWLIARRLTRQTRGLGPVEMTRMYEHHDAVLHAVREGVLILDGDRRLLLANDEARRLLDLPADAEGRPVTGLGLEERACELLASGRDATDEVLPAGERLLVLNNRHTDRNGGPPGSVATLRDATELRALSGRAETARTRLRLLYDASMGIGTTLDITRTAEELAQVAVPRFADYVTVDLAVRVLRGDEPLAGPSVEMRRVAVSGVRDDHPLYPTGHPLLFVPSSPQAAGIVSGRAVLEPRLADSPGWQAQDPERGARVVGFGIHSLICAPLSARGVLLGMVNFWRSQAPEPFDEEDLSLAEELAARAAVCVDNARRYTREHAMAVTLQHSLLPRELPQLTALDAAYRYLPAQAGVGGDWFDVLPLPGARVALVVGDVVGHGLHAAATMGRLRTAVHNFSTLDLPPDELLGHLDELVGRIDLNDSGPTGDGAAPAGTTVAGATCLYAVYDPVTGTCAVARAGHLLPAVVHPDGTVEFPDVPAGPPLGLGGLPFEAVELTLPEGSSLVLYTDGLVEDRDRDIDEGLELLRRSLSEAGRDPEQTCRDVFKAMLPARPSDDIALLVARTRVLNPAHVADWDVPGDPAAVSGVRAAVQRQLAAWGLEELSFTTELLLSELITNAIRYGAEPIQVRLILDRVLICEVSDAGSTSPHLRYAAATDEGGRGLFLVSQFAERWGTRYTPEGKVIWAEQQVR
ncbi:SpoIIE family protein phosphatase [Actinacidiphila glaucinigra]|uniref:Integral membrane sensor protein n=1 Tax=Actinacidiphila glaucinigra TaxID=235986 RepID=A0A239BVK4_9ACTN|nr:integral membrane sensor protein [Actinacidiphila glaucinigra]